MKGPFICLLMIMVDILAWGCHEEFFIVWCREARRDHPVNWEVCCKFRNFGGLDIGNLKSGNLLILVKWLWRFPQEPNPVSSTFSPFLLPQGIDRLFFFFFFLMVLWIRIFHFFRGLNNSDQGTHFHVKPFKLFLAFSTTWLQDMDSWLIWVTYLQIFFRSPH